MGTATMIVASRDTSFNMLEKFAHSTDLLADKIVSFIVYEVYTDSKPFPIVKLGEKLCTPCLGTAIKFPTNFTKGSSGTVILSCHGNGRWQMNLSNHAYFSKGIKEGNMHNHHELLHS